MPTIATIDVGGTGADTAANARVNLGVAPSAAYNQANNAYAQANSAYIQANDAYTQANLAFSRPTTPNLNVTTIDTSAIVYQHYILANTTAGKTLTLPSNPSNGDIIWATVVGNISNNVIARNGNLLQGLAEDMVLNNQYASLQLRYINNTYGWRVI